MRQAGKSVIHIYGASGSGTTTLARYICQNLPYTLMDTDDYFWLPTDPPFTQTRDKEERIRLMRADMEKAGRVVISGSLVDWGDVFIPYFTLCIRLVTQTQVRLQRIRQRERERFGARINLGGDMYQNHQDFLQWAAAYDTGGPSMRSRVKHDQWQTLLQCPQLVLDGAQPLEYNFEQVKKALGACPLSPFS